MLRIGPTTCIPTSMMLIGPTASIRTSMMLIGQNDSDDNGSNEQLSYGLKMRAADPRYITNGDDSNRGHMLLTMAQVRELITRKEQSEEGVATVWLTTAEMCFTLTDEPNAILCPRDVRDGKVSDRYLAPAISRFAVSIQANVGTGAEIDLQTKDVWHFRQVFSTPMHYPALTLVPTCGANRAS